MKENVSRYEVDGYKLILNGLPSRTFDSRAFYDNQPSKGRKGFGLKCRLRDPSPERAQGHSKGQMKAQARSEGVECLQHT